MNDHPWLIMPLDLRHVKDAIEVHMATFSGFFLSFLGRGFLRELYRAYALDEKSVSLAAQDSSSGKLLGIAAGTIDADEFFKMLLLRRWWAFAMSSLPALAKEPRAIPRLYRAIHYRGDAPKDTSRALLSSIAVIPELQRTGLGSVLLEEWENRARQKGVHGCYLTTDAENNDAVNLFYIKNGWKVESKFVTPEKRKMYRYVLEWK